MKGKVKRAFPRGKRFLSISCHFVFFRGAIVTDTAARLRGDGVTSQPIAQVLT